MNKKNIFIKSTICLLIGGFITRLIGFVIRIIYTRQIGSDGISLFAIVMPTYSMLITIASLALPLSVSKLVAEEKRKSVSIMGNALFLTIAINFIIILFMFLSSDFIATSLLNEPLAKNLLIAMSLTLPFVSISSIIKGYFLGKQNAFPYMVSNVLEQLFRFVIIMIFLPILYNIDVYYAVLGIILLSVFSESFSIFVFMFFLPKKSKIHKSDLAYSKEIKKDILSLSVPMVSSRIIGNIGYFFEPIILTNFLVFAGFTSQYAISQYGIYNAYVIPILTMPAFLVQALSQTLIPEISKFKALNNTLMIKKRVRQTLLFTLLVGTIFSVFLYFFSEILLKILYDTNLGLSYIKILSPFFALFYLEGIFYSILQGLGFAKLSFKITLSGVFIKLLFLAVLSLTFLGIYSLIIAEIANILFIVIYSLVIFKKEKII